MSIIDRSKRIWEKDSGVFISLLLLGIVMGALIVYLIIKGQRPVEVPIAKPGESVKVVFTKPEDGRLRVRITDEKGFEGVTLKRPPEGNLENFPATVTFTRVETGSWCECVDQYDAPPKCYPDASHCR